MPGVLMDLKSLGSMGQELVPPLIVQRLGDLVLIANLGHRFAFEALDHDHGFGLRIPFTFSHS